MLASPNAIFLGNHLLAGISPPTINTEVLIPCFYLKGPFLASHQAWNTMDNPGANLAGQREFGDKEKREPRMDELRGGENLELMWIPRLFRAIPEVQPVGFWEFPKGKSIGNGGYWICPGLGFLCGLWEIFGIFLSLPLEKPWKKLKDQPRDEPGTAAPSQTLNSLSHVSTSDLS